MKFPLFNSASNPLLSSKNYPVRADEVERIRRKVKENTGKLIESTPSFAQTVKSGMKDNRVLTAATLALASGTAFIAGGVTAEASGIASKELIDAMDGIGTTSAAIGLAVAGGFIGLDAIAGLKNKAVQKLYALSPSFQEKMDAKIDTILKAGVTEAQKQEQSVYFASQLPRTTLKEVSELLTALNGEPMTDHELGSVINERLQNPYMEPRAEHDTALGINGPSRGRS